MKIRKTEAEIDKMQKEWDDKPCNHNSGYGVEWNNKLGCVTDYFCLRCGFRHTSTEFFNNK